MWKKSYLELLEILLDLNLKFLCPWRELSDKLKLSKRYRMCFVSMVLLVLILTSFVYFKYDNLSFTTVSENMVIAITCTRSFGYAVLVKIFFHEYKKRFNQLLGDRKSLPLNPREQLMVKNYCKAEFALTVAYQLSIILSIFVLLHVFVYLFPNAYHLPFNSYIFFVPPDGFLFAWEFNYLVITIATSLVSLYNAAFIPLPFILMNQSCWLLDMALITTQHMNEHLQLDEDIHDPERVAKTDENLKQLTERCEKFVDCQSETQDLLSWLFYLEFQLQSIILCLAIYVLSLKFAGIIFLLLLFCGVQIYFLCWMGTRVTSRIDQLSFEISKNWYLMPTKQRKSLQMILHWTQNMKGFSGFFSDVNLETCKAIFEASYSFYAFLQSTNGN